MAPARRRPPWSAGGLRRSLPLLCLLALHGASPGLAEVAAQPEKKCEIEIAEECPSASGFDWEAFGEMLYRARSQVYLGDVEAARQGVHDMLRVATSPFWGAFECPPAVAATYFSMAQILAFQGRLRRALAMVQMGFVFIRDKGFSECTPWPLQGWDMLLAGRNLVHQVRQLDDEAVALDTPPSLRFDGQRVAVVTICAYAEDEPVRELSIRNHRMYCDLHGYDLHMFTSADQIKPHAEGNMDVNDGKHKAFFWKVNAVRNVFDQGYDWVLWADCDAFFMEPSRTIDSVIHMYASNRTTPTARRGSWDPAELQRAIHQGAEPPPVSLILAVDSTGINNGVWLLRNDAWARDFLDRWWHSDILQGPGKEHNCSDQSTMQHQLIQERAMAMDASWDEVEGPIWPAEVRVAAQEHLQSFHQATAMTVLSREWQEGDFIKHHPGCHYYKVPCQQMYLEAVMRFEDKVRAMMTQQSLSGQTG